MMNGLNIPAAGFTVNKACRHLALEGSSGLHYYPQFFDTTLADGLMTALLSGGQPWCREVIRLFGRSVPVPREVNWEGEAGLNYVYSGLDHHGTGFSPLMQALLASIRCVLSEPFNFVLMNHYRHGEDYMGWHRDNERVLGKEPVVASLSFGAARPMVFRQGKKGPKREVLLAHGSLLIMNKGVQDNWYHALPKRSRIREPRLNLTFRCLMP